MRIERTTKAKPGASALGLLEQRAMIGAEQAQMIGAAALHEAQIVGMIDDAGEVGVLVIDAHRHDMTAVAEFAVEPASSPRHAGVHRCLPLLAVERLRRDGEIESSRQRTLTSILSGIGARHVERMDAAVFAERVLRGPVLN